jgi:farnesyl diphosphate synthase
VIMGALGAGCEDTATLITLNQFADRLGLAFQLQDDLLDVTGNSKNLGKNTGQDFKHNKATYALLLGVDETKNRIQTLMYEAKSLLHSLSHDTTQLQLLCDQLISREQ